MTRTRSALISAGICLVLFLLTRLPVGGAPPMQFFQPYVVHMVLVVNQVTPRPTSTPAPSATPAPAGAIQNGDFEQGHAVWLEASSYGLDIITMQLGGTPPHSGMWAAWLGGLDDESSLLQQDVTVSQNAPYLSYWHWVDSEDSCGNDVAGVIINNGSGKDPTVLDAFWLCSSTATSDWQRRVVDLHKYIGKKIALGFLAGDDPDSNPSSWYVDDVSTQGAKQANLAGMDTAAIARVQEVARHIVP
jgi:hypothetical protein